MEFPINVSLGGRKKRKKKKASRDLQLVVIYFQKSCYLWSDRHNGIAGGKSMRYCKTSGSTTENEEVTEWTLGTIFKNTPQKWDSNSEWKKTTVSSSPSVWKSQDRIKSIIGRVWTHIRKKLLGKQYCQDIKEQPWHKTWISDFGDWCINS